MGILNEIADLKNTFEGKCLAVLITLALVMSCVSFAALADDPDEQRSEPTVEQTDGMMDEGSATDSGDVSGGGSADGVPPAATGGETPPSDEEFTVGSDEARIILDTTDAFIFIEGQVVSSDKTKYPLHKDLTFRVGTVGDRGIDVVKAEDGTTGEAIEVAEVADAENTYKVEGSEVDSNLVIIAKGKAAASAEADNDTFTKDSVVDSNTPGAETQAPHRVTFEVEGEEYKSVPVEDGALCEEPQAPTPPAGYTTFVGWFQKNADGSLFENPFDFKTEIRADIDLVAKFSKNRIVLFQDADGVVFSTKEVIDGGNVEAIEGPIAPPGKAFDAWYLNGEPYDFNQPVIENITLIPHFVDAHLVYFVTKGTPVDPQWIAQGKMASKPSAVPERTGYEFLHWSASEDGSTGPFLFGEAPIEKDTALYGIWEGKEVAYSVVYWFEKPGIEGDPGTDADNYMFDSRKTLYAQAGSQVSPEDLTSHAIEYGEYRHGDTATIAGSGTTILNVYFKRTVYTLDFYLGDNGRMTFTDSGASYQGGKGVHPCGKKEHDHKTLLPDWSPCYERFDTFGYPILPQEPTCGQEEHSHDASCEDLVYDVAYTFKAKYEQNISEVWPSAKNVAFDSPAGGFIGWDGHLPEFNYTFATHRLTLTKEIISGVQGTTTTIKLDALWEKEVVTYWVNYWLEVADEEELATHPESSIKQINGTFYTNDNAYTQRLIQNTGVLYCKDVEGFEEGVDIGIVPDEPHGDEVLDTYNFSLDRKKYALTFFSGGGSVVPSPENLINYEASMGKYEPATEPTREGFIFAGWYSDSACKTPYDFKTAKMPNRNLELFAKWESSDFTVEFYNHTTDVESFKKQGVARGAFVDVSELYVVGTGYPGFGEFQGWYWYLPGTTKLVSYYLETPATDDIKLYAKWKTEGFSLTYDAGVGTGTVPVDVNPYKLGAAAPVADNIDLTVSENPKMEFVGWQVDGSGKTYYPGNTVAINGNTKLVARYVDTSQIALLTFDANYPEADPSKNEVWKAERGDTVLLPGSLYDRPDYVFTGWNTKSGGDGKAYSGNDPFVLLGTATLYAQWREADPVTIEYRVVDQGSGTVTPESEALAPSTGVALGSQALAGPAHEFEGWYADAACTQLITTSEKFVPAKADEAVWVATTYWAKFNKAGTVAEFFIRADGQIPFEPNTSDLPGGIGYIPGDCGSGMAGTIVEDKEVFNDLAAVAANIGVAPTIETISLELEKYNAAQGTDITFDPATQKVVWYVIKNTKNNVLGGDYHVNGVIRAIADHSVTYDANNDGSNNNVPHNKAYGEGETVVVDFKTIPTYGTKVFLGWDENREATVPTYAEGGNTTTFLMGSQDVTLYAIWANPKSVVTLGASDIEKVYDGQPADSIAATSNAGSDLLYSTDGITWTPAEPRFTDVRTGEDGSSVDSYEVWVKAAKTADFEESDPVKATITITARPLTITGDSATVPYTGSEQSIDTWTNDVASQTSEPKGLVGGHTIAGVTYLAKGTEAKAHTGVISPKSDVSISAQDKDVTHNYEVTTTPGILTIAPDGANYVDATATGKVYDASPTAPITVNTPAGSTISWSDDGGSTWNTGPLPTYTDAGTYVIDITSNNDNYATPEATTQVTITVSVRPLTITGDSATVPYTGSEQSIDTWTNDVASQTSEPKGLVGGHTITGVTYLAKGTEAKAHTGVISPKSDVSISAQDKDVTHNYEVTTTPGILTIEPIDITLTIFGNKLTAGYSGAVQSATGFTTDAPEGVTVTLKSGSLAQATARNVGTQPMNLKADDFSVESNNYRITEVAVDDGWLQILPASVTIKPINTGRAYGEIDPALEATVSGIMQGDTFTGSYDVVRVPGDAPGSYTMSIENAVFADPNYTLRTETGTFVITAADTASIIINDVSKVYDGTEIVPSSHTAIGLVAGEAAEVTYSGTQTEVGSSAASASKVIIRDAVGADVTANYKSVDVVDGTLSITQKLATIVVADASKTVGSADPVFTGTVDGLLNEGDLGEIVYRRTNATEQAAGVYTAVLTADYASNKNYRVEVVPGSFSIVAQVVVPLPTPTPEPTPENPLDVIIQPIADVLEGAVETVINPNPTPRAGNPETAIDDNKTPLSNAERDFYCWVHYYIILGIIITLIYAGIVLVRRRNSIASLNALEREILGDDTDIDTEGKEA